MSALDALLAQGRAAHRDLMLDTIRLYRQAADSFDRTTGTTTPGAQTTYYSDVGRVKPIPAATGQEHEAGEREVTLRDYQVDLPWETTLPPAVRMVAGDRVEVLTSPDSRMVGLKLWITGAQFSATATAWRINAEDRS